MLKDYDMSVLYHPNKANVVADSLSHMNMSSMSHIEASKKDLVKYVQRLGRLDVRLEDSLNGGFMVVRLEDSSNGGFIVHHNCKSSLVVEVNSKQYLDKSLMELKELVLGKLNEAFSFGGHCVLRGQESLCVPKVDELRN